MKGYRYEYKYIINSRQEQILKVLAEGLMKPDPYTDINGAYQVTSLYFDDYNNTCFNENIDGINQRSKFRIRYYNDNLNRITLEKKSKLNGMTKKESGIISKEQCELFVQGKIPPVSKEMPNILQKLLTQMRLKNMQPKIIVSYKRIPYVYNVGNVRITFDSDIISSTAVDNFMRYNAEGMPVLSIGVSLMEVKWDNIFPSYIKEYMKLDSLKWSTFSKYYLCRKYSDNGGLNI